jgi:hypothetical protein
MKIGMALQFCVKFSNIKFNQNKFVGSLFVLACRQTDGAILIDTLQSCEGS